MKKSVIAAIVGTTAIITAAAGFSCVSAATMKSTNQKFSIETPNDNWKEISDPDTKMTLSDGKDMVKICEYGKDETLPTPVLSDDDFKEVYQTYYNVGDTTYVLTGYAVTSDSVAEVRKVVESIQLTDHVKAAESTGTSTAQKTEAQKDAAKTGTSRTIYYMTSNAVTIYEYTDGTWRDDNGVIYWQTVEKQWANSEGSILYDYIPELPAGQETGNSREIYWATGNGVSIKENTDGKWYDGDGISYVSNGDGTWTSSQGSTLYDDPDAGMKIHQQDASDEEETEDDDTSYEEDSQQYESDDEVGSYEE